MTDTPGGTPEPDPNVPPVHPQGPPQAPPPQQPQPPGYGQPDYQQPGYTQSNYPQPPYPPQQPPPGYPPYPTKKRGFPWLGCFIVALVVGLLVVGGCVIGGVAIFNKVKGPADATNKFLAAYKSGNSTSDLVCANSDPGRDLQTIGVPSGELRSYSIVSTHITNGNGQAAGTLTKNDGAQVLIRADLLKEGSWKVCSISQVASTDVSSLE